MVCEIAQHEAFQKILLKKIGKLRKHLEKAENDLDEQMIENEKLKNENEELKKLLNVSLNRGADLRKQVQIEKDRT